MATNIYRPVSERAKAIHGDDDFEATYTAAEERDQLAGDLELVPRPYKVLSDNYSAGKQGDVVDLALPVEIEAALISGGHIERADPEPDEPAGNASTEEWRAYALKHGASEEEVADMGRDDLREKYSAPKSAKSAS